MLTQAFLWRLLDLTEADGKPIDIVVATKFPSYVVRHPEKRVWLVHQFRQAYELDRTELGQFGESAEDRALRRQVQELDRVALGEATRLFATSRNVAGRLERSTGLVAEVLPHPPQELAYRDDGPGDFVLSVEPTRPREADRPADRGGRRRAVAAGRDRGRRARTAQRLEELARERGLDGRVRFAGRVSAERARRPLRDAASRPSTRRSTRTSAWARTSRSCPASP